MTDDQGFDVPAGGRSDVSAHVSDVRAHVSDVPVHVIGASGRSGAALCRALLADGVPVVAVVRSPKRWNALGLQAQVVRADLDKRRALRTALADAKRIACCAHARFAPAVMAAAPPGARLVFLGSTRKYTKFPDEHGSSVLAAEQAFLRADVRGVMLHPTMIYGADGEDNVQRLARLVRRLPFVPLPDGGKAMVQPIHQSDVTRCLRAALDRAWDGPEAMVIAGPDKIPYAEFVQAVARAAHLPPPRILSVSAKTLRRLAPLTLLPGLPRVRPAEIQRLTEDKVFGIAAMNRLLGVHPIALAEGLALTFGAA